MEKRQILIVNDNEYYLRLIASVVEHEGIHVQYASSGEEAVEILKESSFSTILIDLNLPSMGGYELAMLAKELVPDIEIEMITSDISPHLSRLAVQAGIFRVVTKLSEVEQIIQKMVRG
jgi:CheY-like chemotaxis protein